MDVHDVQISDVPRGADAWVAGFPCQPFSSSGHRTGFGHRHGNVFEKLVELIGDARPPVLVFENVEGLLTNKGGHTFAKVLLSLTALGYDVDWTMLNLRWYGVPQTRPRLFLVGRLDGRLDNDRPLDGKEPPPRGIIFAQLLTSLGVVAEYRSSGSLGGVEEALRPSIGKPRPRPPYAFGHAGTARGDEFTSFNLRRLQSVPIVLDALGEIVAPRLGAQRTDIRSVRYWSTDSGRGPTRAHLRREASSHCIGTSLGGAPLYALQRSYFVRNSDRDAFLEYSNWHRDEGDLLVMRLKPSRAVLLFGPDVAALHRAFINWRVGDTRKYALVGNMVAPTCARSVGEVVNTLASVPDGVASARVVAA